jgi:uncharacterized protein YndB with AHSA1/START domain
MNNLTKIKIVKPAHEIFESFVDPAKIGNYWFKSSSERWAQGKTITLFYEVYNVEVIIKVEEMIENEKIVFKWGPREEERVVTITLQELEDKSTIVEVNEEGFNENDEQLISKLVDNKEGWVYMLTCLKGYLEFGITHLRASLVK